MAINSPIPPAAPVSTIRLPSSCMASPPSGNERQCIDLIGCYAAQYIAEQAIEDPRTMHDRLLVVGVVYPVHQLAEEFDMLQIEGAM